MKKVFKQILVPTDFSAGSRLAVDYALALAAPLGASVHLLHVVEDPSVAGLFVEGYPDLESIKRKRRRARAQLAQPEPPRSRTSPGGSGAPNRRTTMA